MYMWRRGYIKCNGASEYAAPAQPVHTHNGGRFMTGANNNRCGNGEMKGFEYLIIVIVTGPL